MIPEIGRFCRPTEWSLLLQSKLCLGFIISVQMRNVIWYGLWQKLSSSWWPPSAFYSCTDMKGDDNMQVQLIRIELRVPEYGWTTQKVFHLLNFIVNGGVCPASHFQIFISFFPMWTSADYMWICIAVRAAVFCLREDVQGLSPEVYLNFKCWLLDLLKTIFFLTLWHGGGRYVSDPLFLGALLRTDITACSSGSAGHTVLHHIHSSSVVLGWNLSPGILFGST